MNEQEQERIIAVAREHVASISLPYTHITLRVGGDHSFGVVNKESRVTVDGIYVIPSREMLGIHEKHLSIRKLGEVNGQDVEYLGDDVGHMIQRIAHGKQLAFELVLRGGRDAWMLLEQHPDLMKMVKIVQDLLAETHVNNMLWQVGEWSRQIKERSFVNLRTIHFALHHALMMLCLAKTTEVVVPYHRQLLIAGQCLRASTTGGIEQFLTRIRTDDMGLEMRKEELVGERGVGAWLDDIVSATHVALNAHLLPPTPCDCAIKRANGFAVEMREKVGVE
jgi:hypothetical protein